MNSKIKTFIKCYRVEIFFVLFCFFFYLAWALFIPYGGGPDEDMRYDIARFIYDNNRLPIGNEPEIVNLVWGTSYGYTPIFAYQIAAIFMKIFAFFGLGEDLLFYAARFSNVVISTLTVIFVLKIGQKCFKGYNRYVFATFVCLLPQFVFISSYVNNDALAMLSTAIIFYAWVIGLKTEWNLKSILMLSLGLSLCFLSYYNAYGFVLCSVILYVGDYLIHKKEWSVQRFLKMGILIVFICVILAGWWFIRSGILHNGDIIGMKTSGALAEQLAQPSYKPSLRGTPQNSGYSVFGMLFGFYKDTQWIYQTYISFLGNFGSVNIPMGLAAYGILTLILLIGGIGFVLGWFTDTRKKLKAQGYLWFAVLILSIIIPICLSVYYSYASDFQPQGRYVMPLLIPLMYFITQGFVWIEIKLEQRKTCFSIGLGVVFINSLVALYALCVVMVQADI